MSEAAEQRGEPTGTGGDAARLLDDALRNCRAKLGAQTLAARLLVVLGTGLGLLLAGVAADHLLPGGMPASWLRWVMPVSVGGVGGAVLVLLLLHRFRPLSAAFTARCLERGAGIRHNSIVNAVLIRQAAGSTYAAEAALSQAARALGSAPPLAPPRTYWPEIAVLAALVAWLVYLTASPKPVGPSVARLLGANLPPPTATRIELLRPAPEDVVHAGEALEMLFAVHGQQVSNVTLELLGGVGQTPRTFPTTRPAGAAGDRFRFMLAPFDVRGDIHFRCLAGDGVLEGVIPVLPVPDVESLTIRLQPPPYTGWPAQQISDPNFEVLAGTQAEFRLRANGPLAEPVFVFFGAHEQRTRMLVDDQEPRAATHSAPLVESGRYRFEFADATGFARPKAPEHRILVRADEPPQVDFPDIPAGDAPIDVANRPAIRVAAADDVRVAAATLLVESNPPATRTPLNFAPGPEIELSIDVQRLPLPPQASIRLWVEVADNRCGLDGRPAVQVTRSRVLTLIRSQRDGAQPGGGPAARQDGPPDEDRAGSGTQEDGESVGSEDATAGSTGTEGAGEAGKRGDEGEKSGGGATASAGDEPSGASEPEDAGRRPGSATATEGADEIRRFAREQGERARRAAGCCRGAAAGNGTQAQPPGETGAGGREAPAPTSDGVEHAGAGQDGSAAARPGDADGGRQPSAGGGSEVAGGKEDDRGRPSPAAGLSDPPGGQVSGPLEPTGIAETLELLDRLDRGEPVSEELLVDAGWSVEEATGFVKELLRLHQALGDSGGATALRQVLHDVRLGNSSPEEGVGVSGELNRRSDATGARDDRLGRIAPPPEQRVPAELSPLLDAYYRAMAAHRAAGAP